MTPESIKKFWEDFNRLHKEEYGHAFPGNPIELVNIRVVATGKLPKMPDVPPPTGGKVEDALLDSADVYFAEDETGAGLKAHRTPFYERSKLAVGSKLKGPAVVVQADSTTVVPPDASLEVLESGDLLIHVQEAR